MFFYKNIQKAIILVRHGEADHHLNGMTGGWTDSNLTKRGKLQAEKNADFLKKIISEKKVSIFSSDLQRALNTAKIIRQKLQCELVIESNLREMNNGLAANCKEEEAKKIARKKIQPFLDWRHYDEGESAKEFYERNLKVFKDIQMKHYKEKDFIVIVAHHGVIRNALYWWLGIGLSSLYETISFATFPGSITAIGVNKWHEKSIFFHNLCLT